jgi:hypothetical protein
MGLNERQNQLEEFVKRSSFPVTDGARDLAASNQEQI